MSFLFQVAAISEQASEITGDDPSSEKFSSSSVWKLFDMHVVVDSTKDIFYSYYQTRVLECVFSFFGI